MQSFSTPFAYLQIVCINTDSKSDKRIVEELCLNLAYYCFNWNYFYMNNNMSATYHNRYVFHCASGGINVAFSPKNSLVFTHYHIHEKKHKGLCKKYEPYILKYMARILKYMAYIFHLSIYKKHNNLQNCISGIYLTYFLLRFLYRQTCPFGILRLYFYDKAS